MRRALNLLAEGRVRLSAEAARAELQKDLMRSAYIKGDFLLASGVRRDYYFDKYLFETRPAILRRLGRFLAEMVPRETDRLAAPALGAVALGTAVSLELGLPMVIVRPQADIEPDSPRVIEGGLYPGEHVTLIEDVVVTGSRASRALARLEAAGAQVGHLVAVLDCLEGARERFAARSVEYRPLFTTADLGIQ
jgi:orotate phosphoribosyltransferase